MKLPITIDHPGEYIAEELEARGWLQRDLAFYLEVPDSMVSMLVKGKRDINASLAIKLASVFDVTPTFFLNLQNEYDTAQATSNEQTDFERRTELRKKFPVREMIKRGWIRDDLALEKEMVSFFSVSRIGDIATLPHAARRTGTEVTTKQQAWLHQVKRLTEEMVVTNYSKKKLEDAVEEMSTLRESPDDVIRVPRLLSESGVRFAIVEGLPGGNIDGVCFWFDKKSPVIGLSTRFDRIDNFWFVLRHEIEHVLRGDGRGKKYAMIDTDVELDMRSDSIAREEIVANRAAANFCVPTEKMDNFFARKYPYISRASVQSFSKRNHVHPGIVVGQLHYRMERHNFLRDLQVKTRAYITSTALTDGWGNVAPID